MSETEAKRETNEIFDTIQTKINQTNTRTNSYVRRIGRGTGILCLLLVPAVSFVLFEYVTGNLHSISRNLSRLNIGWFYAYYILLFGLTGSSRLMLPLASVSLYIISLAETFVVSFRDRPIMIWDVLAVRTAMTVSGNYQFVISREMKIAGALVLAINLILWFAPVRVKGFRRRLAAACACICLSVSYGVYFYQTIVPVYDLGINMWSLNETYSEYGYVLSTAVSFQYMVKKPPQGYSQHGMEEIYNSILADAEQTEPEETGIQPVNLICIMNESLSELRTAGRFETNEEYFPFLNSLSENTVKGNLCVPVFGSMTSNSEFEFLTGDSVAMLPANSIAYQFNVKPKAFSLVSTLKDQGYEAVAMHPYPGENWNRNTVYRNMGFDEFLEGDYYEGCMQFRNYVSDRADYEKLIRRVEEKEHPEDKLFIFNVTMQNHGGYEGIYENFNQSIHLTGELEGKYPKADQYLSLVKESDQAFAELLEYFSQCEEPTMIVMFGDHQPSVEDEFFDEIAGVPSYMIPTKDRLMWYKTPFVIWTNYEQPQADMGDLGAVFLSSYMLKLANLELTPYNQFLLKLADVLPVVHFLGCYDGEGEYYSWEKAESEKSPCQELIQSYEQLVFNHSIDHKKYEPLYRISAEEP